MAMTLDGSLGVTFNDASLQPAAASPYVLKNKIINGDMRIDQRNAGASVNNASSTTYTLDRWNCYGSSATKFSIQQNAGSVTPSTGFTNYLGITSSAATTPGATDEYLFEQRIEGFNVSDLAWGTAGAKTVTLSFLVRSSLTGTFGGAIQNNAQDRVYVFSYTISSANTWTSISVTIPGDTSGTWLTTNGVGLRVRFDLGTGSTYKGTAGSWGSTFYNGVTGGVNVVATNGATFYITGVQLEVGSTATPFERRLYNQELANCQRYYFKDFPNTNYSPFGTGSLYNSTNAQIVYKFPVPMRALATMAISGILVQAGTTNTGNISTINNTYQGLNASLMEVTVSGFSGAQGCWWSTGGNGTTAFVSGSAEL
jgi:hypothetical protein